tara:strand:- start:361 stop:483 length:123 start_codon:yes stop_codon:yes gene_type:complete
MKEDFSINKVVDKMAQVNSIGDEPGKTFRQSAHPYTVAKL